MKQSFWLFGTQLTVLAEGEDNDDRYDLVDGIVPPGAATPLHMHTRYSEDLFTLEGEFTVYLPGRTLVLKAGDRCLIPANTPHAVLNSGNTPARGLVVASPAGFAKLIKAGGTTEENSNIAGDEAFMARFMQASAAVGDVIMGGPGTRP